MVEASPIARSPVAPGAPVERQHGWEVSARRSGAAVRLIDCTPLVKVLVRAEPDGGVALSLGVPFGRGARDEQGVLVARSGPGEWLLLAAPGTSSTLAERVMSVSDDGLVSVFDETHGRALLRLSGPTAAEVLAKVCAIDLSGEVTPDGAVFRTSIARLVTDVVRDDRAGEPSYLLGCDRSSGRYLFDALLDAGAEFGIEVDGFPSPGT